ncbi:MAG: 4-phosphopantetheinyl transferase [Solimicrobium sp.]|nr:4-phosphopantetheinyl transferase [Solimicrobium sp.]
MQITKQEQAVSSKQKFQLKLLDKQETHLWLVETANLPDTFDSQLLLKLSPSEKKHFNTLHIPTVKREYLITRALIRSALSYYADVTPLDWEFVTNKYGCPRLAQRFSKLQLAFNITHSNGAVACLIARGYNVGLDIEQISRKTNFSDFAEMVLSPYEQATLNSQQIGSAKYDFDFLHYWTLKEAYSKALGLGLSIPFTHIICTFGPEKPDELSQLVGYTQLNKDNWQFLQTPILNNHLLAIAIRKLTAEPVPVRLFNCEPGFDKVHPELYFLKGSEHIPRVFVKQ